MAGIQTSSKAMIEWSLKQNPLGRGQGDPSLQAPFNHTAPAARIFLVNHSARLKRRFVKVGVSFKRGAAQALREDAELRKIYNVATLREAVVQDGQDMNVYGDKTAPVWFVPMWNGQRYPVPPAEEGKEPVPVQVPEGMWDILMGNYERMNSPDPRVVAEETMRLHTMQSNKRSAILMVTIDDKREVRDNPFGFIEIIRKTEHLEPKPIDTEFLTALDLVEG